MTKASQCIQYAGKSAIFTCKEGLEVRVVIKKIRQLFGREDVLIQMDFGLNECWVGIHKIKLIE